MLKNKTSKMKANSPQTVPSAAPTMQFGVGIVKGNPRRCLICRQRIRRGEAWVKHTSPTDPELGAYSIIIHDRCNGARGIR